jgi:hypothetical protein
MVNKYSGKCGSCLQFVGAGEGIYEDGNVYCSEFVEREGLTGIYYALCDTAYALELRGEPARKQQQEERKKRAVDFAQKEKEYKENLKSQGLCVRCGGAGRSDMWKDTGYVCYKCEGTGKASA